MIYECELYKLECIKFDGAYDIINVYFKDIESNEIISIEFRFKSIDFNDKIHYFHNVYYNHLENEDNLTEDFIDENYSCIDFLISVYDIPLFCEIFFSKKYSRYIINPFDW